MAADLLRRVRRGPIVLVLLTGNALAVAAALAAAGPVAGSAPSRSTIGRTWPIAEPDALAEIEAKVATLPSDMSKAFGPRDKWSALKAAPLGVATADRVRSVVPFYTLDFDITLPGGKTLYPKGFTFNPLTYVKLPQRLVVVHPRDLGWALRNARASDFILLSAFKGQNGDAIEMSEKTGRPIYILEERVKQRLGLTVAPVIVAQAGQRLVLTEVGPRSRALSAGDAR
ncbi:MULTISPECIES: conjugal transfer protein TraW [Sphingomonadaceae]|jgi:conjugal transfer pilus assembly protein TraW|uniref:conjugal transfer protein TraW n=1 Tax=Sphingomonadales TaxID=204457 RepID=UPI000A3C6887|nr:MULTISPECIES: conjugal transfer protein TraW [Sphingomonadaceae]OUC52967.1 conjugal transfer protein TraW [Sphingobium sp. GW456-12-10-14-TSB1]QCI92920.1 conjugal transfer protein TraW [Novosphingobium sp. EMRT-2]